jgi:hypothetical protein
MMPSIVQTLSVPTIGSADPSRLFQAGDTPMRVVIRNVGGSVIMIAHDVTDLSSLNSLRRLRACSEAIDHRVVSRRRWSGFDRSLRGDPRRQTLHGVLTYGWWMG